jgi:isocitrate lyase
MKKFDLSNFYSQDQIEAYVKKLKEERISWLNGFEGLNPAIIKAFES